jgi:hypothetical protein
MSIPHLWREKNWFTSPTNGKARLVPVSHGGRGDLGDVAELVAVSDDKSSANLRAFLQSSLGASKSLQRNSHIGNALAEPTSSVFAAPVFSASITELVYPYPAAHCLHGAQ